MGTHGYAAPEYIMTGIVFHFKPTPLISLIKANVLNCGHIGSKNFDVAAELMITDHFLKP